MIKKKTLIGLNTFDIFSRKMILNIVKLLLNLVMIKSVLFPMFNVAIPLKTYCLNLSKIRKKVKCN